MRFFHLQWLALFVAVISAPILSAKELSVKDVCLRISGKLASVKYAECDTGMELTGAQSINGTPIIMKEYPPLAKRLPQSRVLLIGGIHGDEYSSVSVVFKWMNKLNRYHSGLFHWKVVPLVNPDGLLQRKSKRMNANGVDLNRNFPTRNWKEETEHYWVKRTHKNPRRYPGKTALSEPETRWLHKLIEEFKPDAIVSVHAPYGVLDFDGPKHAPKKLGHLYLNLLGAYPGSLGNYAGIENDIPVITIELPHAGIMPSRNQITNIWVDLVHWLKKNTPREVDAVIPAMATEAQAGPS